MVDEPNTYAEGRNVQTALQALGALVENGTANDRQRRIYEQLQSQSAAADRQVADTRSTYRGFQRGGTIGLNDNIAGVIDAVTGGSYREGQQEALARDQEAYLNNPDAFSRGQFAGGATAAGLALPFAGGNLAATTAGGLAMGFGQGYGDYELQGSPEGEMLGYTLPSTLIGGFTGVAAPLAGRMAGAATNAIRNIRNLDTAPGVGRVPMERLTRNFERSAETGLPVDQYLSNLTDEAALVDVPGPMRADGQGLAAMRGEGGTALERFVNERAEGAGGRIAQDMDTHIGPANAAFDQRRALATERTSRLGPQYDAALAATNGVEVGPMVTQLRSAAATAGPDTAPILNRYLDHLEARMDEDGFVDAATLHWTRSDLSDALSGIDGPTKQNAVLTRALGEFDDTLDNNVPGYATARTDYGNNRAMERAIDEGQNVLRGGRYNALSPDEFRVEFDAMSPAQQDALRTGLRRDIAALMGTSRNDAAAAWGEFDRGWNPEKLRIALGDDVAGDLIRRLRSEQTFSQTRGDLVAGSQTELRRGAREALDPQFSPPEQHTRPSPINRARNAVNEQLNRGVDALIYGSRNADRNLQLGQALSATGSERDRLVQALIANAQRDRAPSIMDERLNRLVQALVAGSGGSAAAGQN